MSSVVHREHLEILWKEETMIERLHIFKVPKLTEERNEKNATIKICKSTEK